MRNSLKQTRNNLEKNEESLIDKFNGSNSRSLLKRGSEEIFNESLPKDERQAKFEREKTETFTGKFISKKKSLKKNVTLAFDDKSITNESETQTSIKMLDKHLSLKSKYWEESEHSKHSKSKEVKIDKIFVDNIGNIYSQIKNIPKRLKLQNYLIFLIAIFVGIFDWSFIFQLSDNKLERNYCFNNLYQFDSCSIDQICKYHKEKITIIIYNHTIDINSKTKNEKDRNFVEENNVLHNYYRQFFLKYYHTLSSNHLLNGYQLFSNSKDKINFAIILIYKQRWNIFLKYCFICQKKNYSYLILIMYLLGGVFGSIVLGIQADIRGRKKIIQIALSITLLGFTIFVLYFLCLDIYYKKYRKEFKKKYSYENENNIDFKNILEEIYSQISLKNLVNRTFIIFLFGVFITNFGSFPLHKITLALLLENSTNERIVLNNYRKFNFVVNGCSALLTSFFIVQVNSVIFSYILLFSYNLVLLISSFFVLNESMRYLYEYCEWKKLSDIINKTFVLEEEIDIQFLDKSELKLFRKKENQIIKKEYGIRRLNLKAKEKDYIFEKNNFYNYLKRKKSFLIRKIRRQKEVIIKFIEINYNPFIILICLNANRNYVKFKYLLFSILLLLHFFFYILKQEMVKKPFFREKDLYFSIGHNYIINSNFFMLLITSYASNYFYYFLFRFSYFKISIVFSSIILSICSFLYYIHLLRIKKTPLYFNEYNFGMLGQYYRDFHKVNELYVQGMFFTLNGICLYIHLLVIKISKTFYRCTFLMFHSYTILASAIIAEIFNVEIKNPFLLLGFINLLCLLLILFLKEMNDLPNLISDFKQSVDKKLEKYEKSEKLK